MTDPTAAPPANYASYPSLLDRTVLVTGGADGIGAGMVEEFAKQGARVAFLDIAADKAEATITQCVDAGARHRPRFHEVDLTDIDALQAAISRVLDELGTITVLEVAAPPELLR